MSRSGTPPSISFIIPTWNEAANIVSLLADLRTRFPSAERIVVDGGSDDGTLELAREHCEYALRAPAGRAHQMNAGAQRASGDYLFFLHADTRMTIEQSALERELADRPGWGFFTLRLDGRQRAFRVIEWFINRRSQLTQVATGDQTLFVQRQHFLALGGFEEIDLMEDVALSKRLRQSDPPRVVRTSVLTSSRRWEQAGIAKTVVRMWGLRLGYFLGVSPRRLARFYRRQQAPMKESAGEVLLIQFAKAPVIGRVKTRLQPHLTEHEALALHEALVLHTTQRLLASQLGPVQLSVTADIGAPLFQRCRDLGVAQLVLQRGEDLGERMHLALSDALQTYSKVVLVGSDCPALDAEYLDMAVRALDEVPVVLGPASDGGYVLVGLNAPCRALFEGIPWGSPSVLEQSVKILDDHNIPWRALAVRDDVDRPEDLDVWKREQSRT